MEPEVSGKDPLDGVPPPTDAEIEALRAWVDRDPTPEKPIVLGARSLTRREVTQEIIKRTRLGMEFLEKYREMRPTP